MSIAKQGPATNNVHPLRARALVVGVLLTPPLLYWQLQLELSRYSFPTWEVPFYHVVFALFCVALLNLLVRKWLPRAALTGGELAAVYVMVSLAAALFSVDMMAILVSTIAYPYHFASEVNRWGELLFPHLPNWLIVRDEAALTPYYEGSSSLYEPEHLHAWSTPVCAWAAFLFVLVGVMLCLNALLRRQWIEQERLSYPIIRLPLELAHDTGAFLRQRLLWAGFGVAAFFTLVNGLNFLYPFVPAIPLKRHDLAPYFPNSPWNAIGWTEWSMYPFVIGLSFFVPLDLSFSIWIFFLLHKAQLVAASALGWQQSGGFPYPHQQSTGAYLAILLLALWNGRVALRARLREAMSRGASGEALSERWAILGVVAGGAFLIGFAVCAGMSPGVALAFFGLYFAIAVMATRIRAELGFPVHDLASAGPHHTLVAVAGTRALGPQNLTVFALFYWFVRRFTSHPMPHHLEGFKLAERTRTKPRSMATAALIAVVVGIGVGFWLYLDRYYAVGASTAHWNGWTVWLGREVFRTWDSWTKVPTEARLGATTALGVGFCFAVALTKLRHSLVAFPFHPLAFAVASSWGMANLWSCVFLAWLIKGLIMRYAGLSGYRRAEPFFLGLILGEFVCGAAWTLIGIVIHKPTYDFWP